MELIETLGRGRGSVQRELEALEEVGILTSHRLHGRRFFRANRESPIFDELRGIVVKTAGVTVLLAEALQALAGIECAFVYGSVAKGKEVAASDIDVAVVGDVSFGDVVAALREPELVLSREINPTVYTPSELTERAAAKDHFVTALLRGPKQFIVGTAGELGELAQQRLVG